MLEGLRKVSTEPTTFRFAVHLNLCDKHVCTRYTGDASNISTMRSCKHSDQLDNSCASPSPPTSRKLRIALSFHKARWHELISHHPFFGKRAQVVKVRLSNNP